MCADLSTLVFFNYVPYTHFSLSVTAMASHMHPSFTNGSLLLD